MGKKKTTGNADLKDSAKDLDELQPEEYTINLPDVKDIPGQENIVPPTLNEMADMTAASADEEGDELFGDDLDQDTDADADANVSATEVEDLEEAANDMPTDDDINLRRAALDNTDDDGTLLNEGSYKDVSGADLDIPGAEDDDLEEEAGEEDEENNTYSLGGDNHDDTPEDNF
jgi:hypothetical protein